VERAVELLGRRRADDEAAEVQEAVGEAAKGGAGTAGGGATLHARGAGAAGQARGRRGGCGGPGGGGGGGERGSGNGRGRGDPRRRCAWSRATPLSAQDVSRGWEAMLGVRRDPAAGQRGLLRVR